MAEDAQEDEELSVVEREIFIAAPAEIVFRFLVEPEKLKRWLGLSHAREPHSLHPLRIEFDGGHVARGVYTTVLPPHRIAFTWGWEGQEGFAPGTSLVEIELVPRDGGTLVRLRHSGFPEDAPPLFSRANHAERWPRYLARLRLAVLTRPEEDA